MAAQVWCGCGDQAGPMASGSQEGRTQPLRAVVCPIAGEPVCGLGATRGQGGASFLSFPSNR